MIRVHRTNATVQTSLAVLTVKRMVSSYLLFDLIVACRCDALCHSVRVVNDNVTKPDVNINQLALSRICMRRTIRHLSTVAQCFDTPFSAAKCSPVTQVSLNKNVMCIFRGEGRQTTEGLFTPAIFSNFFGYFFGNFRNEASIII